MPDLRLRTSGDLTVALELARRAFREVPAYSQELQSRGIDRVLAAGSLPFDHLPVLGKTYRFAHPLSRLMPKGATPAQNLFSSSGASGQEALWPRAGGEYSSFSFGRWLKERFLIQRRRTLAVVTLTLDRWAGGISSTMGLSHALLDEPGLFTLYCPGPDLRNAVCVAAEHADLYDQFVFFVFPSAVGRLVDAAKDEGAALPWERCRFALTGDPFPESLREWADRLCHVSPPDTALASYAYSSCETRQIGEETAHTIALRRLLHSSEVLRRAFGLGRTVPNLYARVPVKEQPYIEIVDGHIVCTRWQPVPLIRYDLQDRGELWSLAEARRLVTDTSLDPSLSEWQRSFLEGPMEGDIVVVWGRSNALHLYGVKLYEEGLHQVLAHPKLEPHTNGFFHARVDLSNPSRPRLRWDIELAQGAKDDPGLRATFQEILGDQMTQVFPEFGPMLKKGAFSREGAAAVLDVKMHPPGSLCGERRDRKFRYILQS